ncbi:MAG TPA: hypothetical protein VMH81_39145 [Bryobacteraceae bacterium]|nr:hypothetical protein [Bryobacteraceae bacterium]
MQRLTGRKHSGLVSKLAYRFANAFSAALDRIGNQSFFEVVPSIPSVDRAMAWQF